MKPPKHQGQVPLAVQRAALLGYYPGSRAVLTRAELVWLGHLTPTDFSPTYEVVVSHQLRERPLVYVVRPHLKLVPGKRLPHVFSHNVLCLHTALPLEIGAQLLSTTAVPWTKEWLYYYEVWLATGGEWLGGGEHPRIRTTPANTPGRKRSGKSNGSTALSASSDVKQERPDDEYLARLKRALRVMYDPTDEEMENLLFNARLAP